METSFILVIGHQKVFICPVGVASLHVPPTHDVQIISYKGLFYDSNVWVIFPIQTVFWAPLWGYSIQIQDGMSLSLAGIQTLDYTELQ